MTNDIEQAMAEVQEAGGIATEDLMANVRRYVELTKAKREKNDELGTIQDELSRLEEPILDGLASAGVQKLTLDGMTVYKQREFQARLREGVNKAEAFESFKAAGHGDLLALSWQTLRALVAEMAEEGEPLPKGVAEYVDVGEVWRLRGRKG